MKLSTAHFMAQPAVEAQRSTRDIRKGRRVDVSLLLFYNHWIFINRNTVGI